jgi:hypothetical protein
VALVAAELDVAIGSALESGQTLEEALATTSFSDELAAALANLSNLSAAPIQIHADTSGFLMFRASL